MRPTKSLREKYHTDYFDKSDFASRARLLQSKWRTEKGYNDFEKYGNFLKIDFAQETGANFLTPNIFEIVKNEVKYKSIERKVIKEPRIWNNLLSSQPLAFNLFGELKRNTELAAKVFGYIFPDRYIQKIESINFEYSPGRKNIKYTGDSSAFDVFVTYKNTKQEDGFFGIEVKYAEDLNDEPATHKETYEQIAIISEIFKMEKLPELKQKPIQQIWRDHLLALSLFVKNKDYTIGDFIYLYPKDNENCYNALEKYINTFNDNIESYLRPLTIETLMSAIKLFCKDNWIAEFENRYLNFASIDCIQLDF